ncbi:MAG: response regulator [Stellaceae bacterium]
MARILLVEDHDGIRDLVRTAIEAAAHKTDCVTTRAEAEHALGRARYHLLICNLRLPDGSGQDLIARAHEFGVPGVLMTGPAEDAGDDRTAGIPSAVRLRKPFRLEALYRAITESLRSSCRGRSD